MSYGYMPAPPPPPMALQKSWFSRNWKWFVPALVLGLAFLLAAAVGVLASFVFGMMKSSVPYQHAVAVACNNPDVIRELGAPVSPGWYVSGNERVSAASGEANLAIPLNGKLRHGTVYVVAKKTGGVWTYTTLQALVDGNQVPIELLSTSPPKDK